MRKGILIPTYQPDEKMPAFVRECREAGFEVLVVNDGSTRGMEWFEEIRDLPGVTVEGYAENRGKGFALKYGIRRLAAAGFGGVITADSDGQHTIVDLKRVAEAMEAHPGMLVLGSRDTALMPPKSQTGNRMTRKLFRMLYGVKISDTQTGLRGIPLTPENTEQLGTMKGDRYEYEMAMLVESPNLFPAGVLEVPIETVYFEQNAGSHFRPLKDGARIYAVLFRRLPAFLLSSLLSFGIDYSLFNGFFYLFSLGTVRSTVSARIISATANYLMNRHRVFKGSNGSQLNVKNYILLAVVILLINTTVMHLLVDILGLPAFAMKIAVECVLYVLSFTVQNRLASKKTGRA